LASKRRKSQAVSLPYRALALIQLPHDIPHIWVRVSLNARYLTVPVKHLARNDPPSRICPFHCLYGRFPSATIAIRARCGDLQNLKFTRSGGCFTAFFR